MPLAFRKIVAFGDSVTRGGDASSPDRAWIQRLCRWIEELQGFPVELVNHAVGGSVVSPRSAAYEPSRKPSGRERFDEAALAWPDPDLILVGYGFNDARGGEPPAAFLENLRSLVEDIRGLSQAPIVLLGPYYTSDRFGYGPEWSHASEEVLREFSAGIDALAREAGCLRADVLGPLGRNPDLLAPDGVHPNDAGHLVIAAVVFQTLASAPGPIAV